jgi:hypothetical protein
MKTGVFCPRFSQFWRYRDALTGHGTFCAIFSRGAPRINMRLSSKAVLIFLLSSVIVWLLISLGPLLTARIAQFISASHMPPTDGGVNLAQGRNVEVFPNKWHLCGSEGGPTHRVRCPVNVQVF